MKCDFTYIKMKHSKGVEEHCQQLLNKLEKFLDRPLKGHFTFSMEGFEHKTTLTLTGKNLYFKAEADHENFYSCIEACIDKMHRQLDKKKGKMKNHKFKKPAKELNNLISLAEYRQMLEIKRRIG